jgi:hypothetical protein
MEDPIPTYTLSSTVSPAEAGKITASPSPSTYPEGTQVTLTAEPNENWVFKQWEGDATGSTTPLQLTMTANKNVVGVFVKRDYPLNIKIEGEGTVGEKIVPNPSGREYPHGTKVELKPIPKEGWVFESWGGDLSGIETPQIITVDKEKNVIVKFKRKDYPLNLTITGEGTVEEKIISTPGGRTYPFQTIVQLTPKAKEGWEFESWGGDLTGNETPKNITVDKEKNVIAKFKRKNYLKTSYELSNYEIWFSSAQLFKSDGEKYNYNPFIDEQSAQLDIDGDGLEDVFYFEGYDLQINPTPNPPPSIFLNTGSILKQTSYSGPNLKNPHGVKLLVGDFNNDFFPDIFSNVAVDPPLNQFPFLNDNCHLIFNSTKGFDKVKEFTDEGFWYTGCSGDIDNDGDLDIITFNFHNQGNGIKSRIMWNDGTANFSIDFNGIGDIPVVYQSELVDVNFDGFLDLVITFIPNGPTRTNDLRILWGNGKTYNLTNSTKIDISPDWYLMNLDFVDLDKDGIMEVLPSGNFNAPLGGPPSYFISIFKSDDKGKTFANKTNQYIDGNVISNRFYHIRVQDIDKNGFLDIFSGDKKDNIRWEWNGSKFLKK